MSGDDVANMHLAKETSKPARFALIRMNEKLEKTQLLSKCCLSVSFRLLIIIMLIQKGEEEEKCGKKTRRDETREN